MARPAVAATLDLLVVTLVLVAGCGPAVPPVAKQKPVGPAEASHDHGEHAHEGHDHGDHAGHDHHDGHDQGASTAGEAASAAAGAADADEHGHHHPETLGELVGELEKIAAVVKEGMEANIREKADSPVHEFGHYVGDVEELAKGAKLPADVEAAVIKAGEELFNAFDKLDEAIHGSGDISLAWGEQSPAIEAGMKTLKDAVAK